MKSSHQAGFAALCILSGSGWLLGQIYPSAIGFPMAGCIHFLMIALVASLVWMVTRAGRIPLGSAAAIALAGAGVFALPGVAAHMVAGAISEATNAALFCSIPLLTLLSLKFSGPSTQPRSWSRPLLASVVGVGGVVVLLSADLPGTPRGWLYLGVLAGCCAATALAGIWIHGTVQRVPVVVAVTIAGLGSAALLASGITRLPDISLQALGPECLRCLVVDLPVVWLTTWLIREVDPARMAARYLLIPVVTALEGYAVMRGGLDTRSVLALGGMVVGGIMVFLGTEREEIASLRLR